jgi:hypothetical protein
MLLISVDKGIRAIVVALYTTLRVNRSAKRCAVTQTRMT